MVIRFGIALASLCTAAACASPQPQNPFTGVRTVFDNPYAAPELRSGPVGPEQCEACPGLDGRWLDGLFYPGRGRFAYNRDGERVQLSRSDRRELRRRFQMIEEQADINRRVAEFNTRQNSVPPTVPSAPPVAIPNSRPSQAEPPASTGANRASSPGNQDLEPH